MAFTVDFVGVVCEVKPVEVDLAIQAVTNLGIISVDLIFLRPQSCKSRLFEDSTKNGILEPREPRSED